MSRRLAFALLLGALLRAVVLTSPGTPDVTTWKSWSYVASIDPLGLYGTGGNPPERRLIRWNEIIGTTEYPPLALYQVGAAGAVYRRIDPVFRDSRWLTVLIKSPGLLIEMLLVGVLLTGGRRVLGPAPARWMALAIWLNPAVIINGAALGYLDAQMALPAVAALIAVMAGRPGLAGALAAAAVLTKLQAVFLAPALLLALVRQRHMAAGMAIARSVAGAAATAAALVLPIVWHGAWPNMVQAIARATAHDMLSGYGLNVWWVVTWLVRSTYAAATIGWTEAFTSPVRILGIARFIEVGYPNPKPIGAAIVIALASWGYWRYRRSTLPATWAYFAGWTVFTYFLWNLQVHENHLYMAVPALALAAALDQRYRTAFWVVSAIVATNMYLFYGLGDGWPPVIGMRWTGVDLSVFLAAMVCGIWVWLTLRPPVPVDA